MSRSSLWAAWCCLLLALAAAPTASAAGAYKYTDACIAESRWDVSGGAPGSTGTASRSIWNADCTKVDAGVNAPVGGTPTEAHRLWRETGWGASETFDFQRTGVGCTGRLISRGSDQVVGTVVSDATGQVLSATLERVATSGATSTEKFVPIPGESQACGNARLRAVWSGQYQAASVDGLDSGANPDNCNAHGGDVCYWTSVHANWYHPDEYHPWFPGDPFWIEEATHIRLDARSFVTEDNQSELVDGYWKIEGLINCYYWGPYDYRNERLSISIQRGQGDAVGKLEVAPDGRTATFEASGSMHNPCIGGSFPNEWHFSATLVAGTQGDSGQSVGCDTSQTTRTWAAGPSTASFVWYGESTHWSATHNTATNITREARVKPPAGC